MVHERRERMKKIAVARSVDATKGRKRIGGGRHLTIGDECGANERRGLNSNSNSFTDKRSRDGGTMTTLHRVSVCVRAWLLIV